MVFLPGQAQQTTIQDILGRGETAVVLEQGDGVEIVGVANYPKACREYYIGRLVVSVFRTQFDLDARLALARAKAGKV